MGEAKNGDLRVSFDSRVKLKFLGSKVTTDAGLVAYRELDETLGLTEMGVDELTELRLGNNKQHQLVPLLRQSVYSRLAGYEDVNDAERFWPSTRQCAVWLAAGLRWRTRMPLPPSRLAGSRPRFSAPRTTWGS